MSFDGGELTKKLAVFVACVAMSMLIGSVPAAADEDQRDWGPPMPGVALKTGAGLYHSVPCGCIDRGIWDTELSGRLHFGWRAAVEGGLHYGAMLLGGRFPTQGWSVGGRFNLLSERGRWWEGLGIRAGYKRWAAMGMRETGTHTAYGALNWSVQVFSHLYIETDALVSRTFQTLSHWEFGARLGVATRF